jgi:hypothetical protein
VFEKARCFWLGIPNPDKWKPVRDMLRVENNGLKKKKIGSPMFAGRHDKL